MNNKEHNSPKVAVFCHIYYSDLVDTCMSYILNVPSQYDVYISYVTDETGKSIEQFIKSNNLNHVYLRKKPNRGRDVSALVVTFREDILKYDLFCFLHDKKSIGNIKDIRSVDAWRESFFHNLLYGKKHIENVVKRFTNDSNLGIVTTPQPYEGEYLYSFNDEWLINYSNAKDLCQMLGLSISLNENIQPKTLGTAFWARTDALRKLLEYPFTYDDFPQEPMKPDGQLGHAIERMLGFIAEDAGYACEIIMSDEYAQKRAREIEQYLRKALTQMRKLSFLKYEEHFDDWSSYVGDFFRYCISKDIVYIYGSGFFGEKAVSILNNMNVSIKSMIVSDGFKRSGVFHGIPVLELSDVELNADNIGVLIAVSEENGFRNQIIDNLIQRGYTDYFVLR